MKKTIINTLIIFLFTLFCVGSFYPSIALAQASPTSDPASFAEGINRAKEVDDTLGKVDIYTVIENVINTILSFVAILGLIAFIIGGVMYIMSFGDEQKTARAKKIILYAILGMIIAGGAFAIVETVKGIIVPTT
jgi:flavin-binding protein dodecin